jgi:hypothetical protein
MPKTNPPPRIYFNPHAPITISKKAKKSKKSKKARKSKRRN